MSASSEPGAGDARELLRRELARVDWLLLGEVARAGEPARAAALVRELADEHGARPGPAEPHEPGAGLPGLEHARLRFRLTAFEREALVIALAAELDERYAAVLALLHGDPARRRPSVGQLARWLAPLVDRDLAAAAAALGPDGHLSRTGLVEVIGDGPRSSRTIRIPEAFWPRLVGIEAEAGPFPVRAARAGALSALVARPETRAAAEAAVAWCRQRRPHECLLVLDGPPGSGRETLAWAIASELGFAAIPVDGAQLEAAEALPALVREAAWHDAALVVRDPAPAGAIARACRELTMPVIALGEVGLLGELVLAGPRTGTAVEVRPLERAEREALWERALGERPRADDLAPGTLAARFRFGPARIAAVAAVAASASEARGGGAIAAADVQAALRTTPAAGSLAARIECPYDEGDLVLPLATSRELALVLAWARHGAAAFRAGGAGGRLHGQHVLVCLFTGPPGTGKTMAAQVIARALHLHLLRVDLSQVASKYIGETEKNLDRVFAEAEATGSLLFFDEADALFGKRTAVKDAHDRYANLETAFLLQRIERHHGIVILASNLRDHLDAAFVRRIQVVAEFPLPGPAERRAIWERHLAREHLAPEVDLAALATFALAGGDIRNAAVTAVLLAADDGAPVAMRHLVVGIWRELHKTGRLAAPDDFGAWRHHVHAYLRDGARTPTGR